MTLEDETRSVGKWYDIREGKELVEAIENIKKRADLGDVKTRFLKARINYFEKNKLIAPDVAQSLREHLDSLRKNK